MQISRICFTYASRCTAVAHSADIVKPQSKVSERTWDSLAFDEVSTEQVIRFVTRNFNDRSHIQ